MGSPDLFYTASTLYYTVSDGMGVSAFGGVSLLFQLRPPTVFRASASCMLLVASTHQLNEWNALLLDANKAIASIVLSGLGVGMLELRKGNGLRSTSAQFRVLVNGGSGHSVKDSILCFFESRRHQQCSEQWWTSEEVIKSQVALSHVGSPDPNGGL